MNQRDRELDFIKVLATILIVLHHYQQVMNVTFRHFNFFGGKFYFGNLVELFFIISGICAFRWIDGVDKNSSFAKFYANRVRRLLPIMILSILVDAAMCTFFSNIFNVAMGSNNINLKNIIVSCLGVQAGWIFENPMINNPVWYISVLLLCYIIFFIITKLSKKIKISPYFAYVTMVFVGFATMKLQLERPFLNEYTYRGYICFFEGVLLGTILNNKKDIINKISIFAIIPFVIGVVAYLNNFHVYYMLVFLMWPSIIILLKNSVFEKIVNHSFWSSMAKISYDTYVWHCPILHLVLGIAVVNNIKCYNMVWFMILILLIVIVLGGMSYKYLEQPIQKTIGILIKKSKKE